MYRALAARFWRRRVAVLLLLAVPAAAGAAFFVFRFYRTPENNCRVLEISDSVSRGIYGTWPMDEAGEFALEFIHSVNQSPVRETFRIDGKKIRPFSVRFFSFGAGMLSDVGEGRTMSRDGDALVISGFNTSFEKLNLIVGTVSDHLLFINGETVSLRNLCGKNAHIIIQIK